ncbi:hypothetical protein [Paraburkholderia sp.]|jgi:hypothetical protein|uniref:hypothetical protein n=1 Tax=Paraburkholderia sp. TaxID=1926495 RepID=UPI002F400BFA
MTELVAPMRWRMFDYARALCAAGCFSRIVRALRSFVRGVVCFELRIEGDVCQTRPVTFLETKRDL